MPQQVEPSHSVSPRKSWGERFSAWYWPIIFAVLVSFAIERGIEWLFDYPFGRFLSLLLFFTVYFVLAGLLKAAQVPKAEQQRHPANDWPISGPIRYLGRYASYFTFLPSLLLSSLNPWQLVQQFKQLGGQLGIAKRIKGREAEIAEYQTKVSYRLPFDGEWLTFNGGLTQATSHSWGILTQRYAYDFVQADEHYRRHHLSGARLQHYFCYNQPILAAADGEVVAVVDKIGPAPLVGFCVIDFWCRHFAGNHVIIKHAEGEYGFYAHLVKGSMPVTVGDHVQQGQHIGNCGHTGHSTEPHLHFHLQDGPNLFTAMGLPIRFEQVGEITRGQRVEHK